MRAGQSSIIRYNDPDFPRRFGGQAQSEQVAALLKRDRIAAERREVDVVVAEVRDLAHPLRIQVIRPQVGAPIGAAVGQKIDLPAEPHGICVRPLPGREAVQLPGVEVIGEDVLLLPADIPLAGIEISEDAVIGDAFAIGSKAHHAGAVERQPHRETACERNAEGLEDFCIPCHPLREEDDSAGIRRPGENERSLRAG